MGSEFGRRAFVVSIVLSAVFTYAFLYVAQAVPFLLDRVLRRFFPDVPLGMWDEAIESMLPYGYVALAVAVLLVIAGLVGRRLWLSKFGALVLYIPTFGYFAVAMFLLAGVGVLRLLWLPVIQPGVWRLGHAVLLPVHLFIGFLTSVLGLGTPYSLGPPVSLFLRALGIFVFFLGVASWLYGRYQGLRVIDIWIYRYSRHPQYLGFLIWSYGLLTLVAYRIYVRGAFAEPPTLIWLIMACLLTLVALREEGEMVKRHGEEYLAYASKTPFYLPLPRPLVALLTLPHRLLRYEIGSWRRGGLVILIYAAVIVLISYLIYCLG